MEEGAHGRDNFRQAILPPFLPSRMVSSQAPGLSFLQAHQLHGQREGWQGQALCDGRVFCTKEKRAQLWKEACASGVARFPIHSASIPDPLTGGFWGIWGLGAEVAHRKPKTSWPASQQTCRTSGGNLHLYLSERDPACLLPSFLHRTNIY